MDPTRRAVMTIARGGIKALRGASLRVRIKDPTTEGVWMQVTVHDKQGHVISQSCDYHWLDKDCTFTALGVDEAFKINVQCSD